MAYTKSALPSASKEKTWLCETYGGEFCEAFERWCNEIVVHAPTNPRKLLLCPLEEILDEKHTTWSHVWKNLHDKTAIDRLRSLLAFIRTRKPPFELFAVHARFLAQSRYWINVIAVVDVNHADKQVVFTYFHWYGDGS